MAKKILEDFDEKQAQKSEDKEAVVEPVKESAVAEPEDEAKSEPEVEEAVAEKAAPEAEPAHEEAQKDADESGDVDADPKPFEKDGKVQDAEDHANGGDYAELSKLTQTLATQVSGVKKSLEDNQETVSNLGEKVAGVTAQLDEIRKLVVEGFAQKADDPKDPAEAKEDAKEDTEKCDPDGECADDKKDKAEKSDKSKACKDDDEDDEDDEEASDKKEAEAKPAKKEAKKSLEAEDVVAEPVEDEPLYVAKKSAAEGSVAQKVAPKEEPEAKPEEAEKSLQDQFVAAQYAVGEFNDKLISDAKAGRLTRPEYTEKSLLGQDIAYGRDITQEKLDEFTSYIKK